MDLKTLARNKPRDSVNVPHKIMLRTILNCLPTAWLTTIPTHTRSLYMCTCVSYLRKLSTQLRYDFQHISQRKLKPKEIITKSKTSRRNAVTYGPSCIFICIQYICTICAHVCMCRVIEKYFLLIYWICIVLLQTNLNEYMYNVYMNVHVPSTSTIWFYIVCIFLSFLKHLSVAS